MAAQARTLETVWRDLRPHLEWAQGFNLVLLFARHPQPIALLRQRLDDSLQLRTLQLHIFVPKSPAEVGQLADAILNARPGPASGPLWVELWRYAHEPDWQQARALLLHSINERRFLLERDVRQPLVLLLPPEERAGFYAQAPDLWAIRSYTAELPEPEFVETALSRPTSPESKPLLGATLRPAETEWQRLGDGTRDRARLDPRDGFAAFESAWERGDLQAAKHIAAQTLELARSLTAGEPQPAKLRNLSVSLDNVGQVERDLGNLEAARAAYRESLDIAQRLRVAFPDRPQFARDLASIETRFRAVEETSSGDSFRAN